MPSQGGFQVPRWYSPLVPKRSTDAPRKTAPPSHHLYAVCALALSLAGAGGGCNTVFDSKSCSANGRLYAPQETFANITGCGTWIFSNSWRFRPTVIRFCASRS